MNRIAKRSLARLGYGFLEAPYLPEGKDEYYLRNEEWSGGPYRRLTPAEIDLLVRNGNSSGDWSMVQVAERFDPALVWRCEFHGLVRIGALEPVYLEFHDLRLPVGLYDSTIISCDIGSNVVIDNVRYLAHYLIHDEAILLSVNEMLTTDHSKFGNGIVKEGEPEEVRIWLEVGNENGGRKILPFDGMLPADAYLWSKYRGDARLMERFKELTDRLGDPRRGRYGVVGERTIIKHCQILKDVRVGSDAYIKGASKLKNLTINSSAEAPTQIGEGVELVNGIIGYGCRIFYGVKAVRFVMGSNSSLKYGARLINALLGDNSTISCCEVLNSLIFPGHEQHHNNSFLCAATVLGQSNVAAGATIGSNHNSRGSDGELSAGRGFWPGLCVSLKHSSRFASFALLAKGSYPAELDIPLPFALVSNSETRGELQLLPAYWFLYNMYALARNSWKYAARDLRVVKDQIIEVAYLAPDTIEEIFRALGMLEEWVGEAALRASAGTGSGQSPIPEATAEERATTGRRILREHPEQVAGLRVLASEVEASERPVVVLKTAQGYAAYREMVALYAVQTLADHAAARRLTLPELCERLATANRQRWINLGGQLICEKDLLALKRQIVDGALDSWGAIHAEYHRIGERYAERKAEHAFASLLEIEEISPAMLDGTRWRSLLARARATGEKIARRTRESRQKDYDNRFRRMMYESPAEMAAVVGTIDGDSFVRQIASEAEAHSRRMERAEAEIERRPR